MGRTVVLDYGAGNLRSVVNALRHLGCTPEVTDAPATAMAADRVIFPGVGGATAAMAELGRTGLDRVLREVYRAGRPLLGICLGSQIVFDHSDEGDTACLGLLGGRVRLLAGSDAAGLRLKVPHMGWNRIHLQAHHPVFDGIEDGAAFYFVHSYRIEADEPDAVLATVDYGGAVPAVVGRRSFVATQFHLEKSGESGLRMLANFLAWDGGPSEGVPGRPACS